MNTDSSALVALDAVARTYDETNVPLYISYPTSGYWKTTPDPSGYAADCAAAKNPFLYFHFPFCEQICHYCMCYKVPNLSVDDRRRYLDAMIGELTLKAAMRGNSPTDTVTHLHWGGGTPTCMTAAEMEHVFTAADRHFPLAPRAGGSFSIEAFPRSATVTEEKCSLLSRLGFNEISFGVQDLSARVQKAINRSCTFEELSAVVERSRNAGLAVHIDLCYGLPFQELGEFEKTVRRICSLAPDRVAMLTYVHYPHLFPNQRNIPVSSIPNSFMRVLLADLASDLFLEAGYCKVGFDHFVRPENPLARAAREGTVTRDLMGYSVAERKNVLGFGSSAISYINGTYYHNAMKVDAYTSLAGSSVTPLHDTGSHTMSNDDRIRSEIIETQLLSRGTINIPSVEERFSIVFGDYFAEELQLLRQCENDALVTISLPHRIDLTPTGRLFCRHVARVFDRYCGRRPVRH